MLKVTKSNSLSKGYHHDVSESDLPELHLDLDVANGHHLSGRDPAVAIA
jgi:hypothetical protein